MLAEDNFLALRVNAQPMPVAARSHLTEPRIEQSPLRALRPNTTDMSNSPYPISPWSPLRALSPNTTGMSNPPYPVSHRRNLEHLHQYHQVLTSLDSSSLVSTSALPVLCLMLSTPTAHAAHAGFGLAFGGCRSKRPMLPTSVSVWPLAAG